MPNYSGLWDRFYGVPYLQLGPQIGQTINTTEFNNNEYVETAKIFRDRGQRAMARILHTLIGAAPGATATETNAQLTSESALGNAIANGGRRTVAPVTMVNRVTTAADQTYFRNMLTQTFGPTPGSYPRDLSGNGGGGKLGGI